MDFSNTVVNGDLNRANEIFDNAPDALRRIIANQTINGIPMVHYLFGAQCISIIKKIAPYADLNVRDTFRQNTPLIVAMRHRIPDLALLFIELGADAMLSDCDDELPIHIPTDNEELFKALLSTKPSFNLNSRFPMGECWACRSQRGHNVHCTILMTMSTGIARLAFDYVESTIQCQRILTMYFQLFIRLGDIHTLHRIIQTHTIDPSDYSFVYDHRIPYGVIPNGCVASFLSDKNLLNKKYANQSIANATTSGDPEFILILVAHDADISNVNIENMIMYTLHALCDIITLLISTGNLIITPSVIGVIASVRDKNTLFLSNHPESSSRLISAATLHIFFPFWCHGDKMTFGELAEMRIRNVDMIKDIFRMAQILKDDDLPNLYDMVKFERQKESWRRRIQELKFDFEIRGIE